jgi:hypothetical protein
MLDRNGIIRVAAECWSHPTADTGNLFSAGCGNVILPHIAPPASMSSGGFSMSTPTAKYYVYGLSRPNGKVFYVGKGSRNRMYAHAREAKSGHKCHKCNVIRKIWRGKGEIAYCTYWAGNNEDEAFEQEQYWIAFYGLETLTNRTAGGEGLREYEYTDEHRKRISEKALERWGNPEFREQRGKGVSELWQDEEYREKVVTRSRAAQQTPESRKRKSEAAHERWSRPGFKARAAEKIRERWKDPEYRKRASAAISKAKIANRKPKVTKPPRENPYAEPKIYHGFVSPSGEVHTVVGLKAFCKTQGLDLGAMSKVYQGKRKQHKGWTIIGKPGYDTGLMPSELEACKRAKELEQGQ